MSRPALEVADIFRDHGPAWRRAMRGHISIEQLKVMSAIEACRTADLGGHVARCSNPTCGHTTIAFNSCKNRHCPKCQGSAARKWLAKAGYDPAFGARPLRRAIQKHVESPLSVELLGNKLKDGAAVKVDVDPEENKIIFHTAEHATRHAGQIITTAKIVTAR